MLFTRVAVGRLSVFASSAALAAATAARGAVTTYTISGMGIPDATSAVDSGSVASAISNGGYVTGSVVGSNGYTRGFEYRNGTLTDLPTLGGRSSEGGAVNDVGQVAGDSRVAGATPTEASFRPAVVWTNGVPTSLGSLGGTAAYGFGINNAGQVAGYSTTAAGVTHAFRSGNGTLADLGTLGGPNSYGNAINAAGVVAGTSDVTGAAADGSGPYVGVYWDAAGAAHAIPTFGGAYGNAAGINAAGTVTGSDDFAGDLTGHAYTYTASGTLTDLGGLSADFPITAGDSINALNQVVGYAQTLDGSDYRATLYSDGQMYDLNDLITTPGWTLQYASSINDAGQIVGQGIDPAGFEHAFLLTPTASVPEPAGLTVAAVAIAGFTGGRRRRGRKGSAFRKGRLAGREA